MCIVCDLGLLFGTTEINVLLLRRVTGWSYSQDRRSRVEVIYTRICAIAIA